MLRPSRFPPVLLPAIAAIAIAAACNQSAVRPAEPAPAVSLPSGYTCCNFRYDKDWINDGNYAQLPLIPAGTPIKVTGWGRHRAHVEIDGKPFRLGLDYGREAETIEKWVAKLIVAADPRAKLAEYPPAVRKAIEGGQVMVGMSREQVIMSLGHPLTSENPRLDAPFWRYWWSSFGEYQVHWAGERVAKVTGHPETLALMLAPGNAAGAAAPPSAAAPAAPAAPPAKTTPKATKGKSGGKPASPAAK